MTQHTAPPGVIAPTLAHAWMACVLLVIAACDGTNTGGAGHDADARGDSGAADGGDGGAESDASVEDPECLALAAELQETIDEHYANPPASLGGASVAVIRGSCRWVGVVGEAHAGVPMTPAHPLRIASVTKTYVAATLLALVDEGALGLEDLLEDHVPGVAGGDGITVRMLLNHTSGIYDYVSDVVFWAQALAQPEVAVTPQELVDVGTSHPANFAPGEGWDYSNTGFILAGMVIEAVTNVDVGTAIRQRAFDVAGLTETFFDGEETLPSPPATGFGAAGEDLTDALHPSVNWTAGAVVATAGDLADWAAALYGGQVLSPGAMAEMLTPVETGDPGLSSGLGAFLYDESRIGGFSPAVGHSGRLPGYASNMLYLQDDGTVVVQITNTDAGKNYTGVLLAALYGD